MNSLLKTCHSKQKYSSNLPTFSRRAVDFFPSCLLTTCSIRQMIIICHYKLWDSCQLLSLRLTFLPFGLNLDPGWATSSIKMQQETRHHSASAQIPHSQHTHTHSHTQCLSLFYYDELVHCTSHQYPITHFPTKYLPLPMASPSARSKRSHN